MNVFVCVQIAYLFSCRALDGALLAARPGRNPVLALCIGLTVGPRLLITYLPAMNTLCHTAPVGLGSWSLALGAALLAFVLVEADKVLWRRG